MFPRNKRRTRLRDDSRAAGQRPPGVVVSRLVGNAPLFVMTTFPTTGARTVTRCGAARFLVCRLTKNPRALLQTGPHRVAQFFGVNGVGVAARISPVAGFGGQIRKGVIGVKGVATKS